MKKFSIPVTWQVWDKIEVKAETIEEAIQYVKDHIDEFPLGTEPEYIDGSYCIDDCNNGESDVEETVRYLKECWDMSGGITGEEVRIAYNIQWDVDDTRDLAILPKEVEIPEHIQGEDAISDYLSDITGFCHKGFELK